jgi:hypothetical protein
MPQSDPGTAQVTKSGDDAQALLFTSGSLALLVAILMLDA